MRSPGEFAVDHAPGAVNLPVLDDAQRAEVGTIYVQQSKFLARRVGAAHVARNIAGHLQEALADKPAGFAPLVYCWRGGQRSNAMATVLAQVGWRVTLLQGGYRTWRRHVSAGLYDEGPAPSPPQPFPPLVLLDGGTGTGKTALLGRLAAQGVQTLDLEGLARHRGSLFGALPGRPQPSQKLFESRLLAALERLDPAQPVVVEAESSRIGQLTVPPRLWRAMVAAPRIVLAATGEARARYLVTAYSDFTGDLAAIETALARLPVHHSRQQREAWRDMARAGELEPLAAGLIEAHYDPAYRRSAEGGAGRTLGEVPLDPASPASLDQAAGQVARLVATAALERDP